VKNIGSVTFSFLLEVVVCRLILNAFMMCRRLKKSSERKESAAEAGVPAKLRDRKADEHSLIETSRGTRKF
jgi:hypothetical protein